MKSFGFCHRSDGVDRAAPEFAPNQNPKDMLTIISFILMRDSLGKDNSSRTCPMWASRLLVATSGALMLFTNLYLTPYHHQFSWLIASQGLFHSGVGQLAQYPSRTGSSGDLLCGKTSLGDIHKVQRWINCSPKSNIFIGDGELRTKCPLV